MADDALLSDLCSICNTAKFKYRCPGCSARTCSLPCYKRHQQWAQCNGKRDPAKFVKKSQLATPAGIDHDYNFLTGIERSLERAEKHVEDRCLGSTSGPHAGRQLSDHHFAMAGVTVVRAPEGLSRHKENNTHRTKKGNIAWTVEWIYEDTTRVLTESTSAVPLLQSQPFEKSTKSHKKRKRDEQTASIFESADHHVSTSLNVEETKTKVQAGDAQPEFHTVDKNEQERDDTRASTGNEAAKDASAAENEETKMGSDGHGSLHIHGPDPESVPHIYAFYLLRPRTSSNRRVLIALDPTATLGDCLRDRTVLEFPTIYIFPISTPPPPEKFMLEAEYLKQEGEEQREFEDLMKQVSPDTLRALKEEHGDDDNNNNARQDFDSDKIFDVLKQDIGAGA